MCAMWGLGCVWAGGWVFKRNLRIGKQADAEEGNVGEETEPAPRPTRGGAKKTATTKSMCDVACTSGVSVDAHGPALPSLLFLNTLRARAHAHTPY